MHGKFVSYFDNGVQCESKQYKDGYKDGPASENYYNGTLYKTSYYCNNVEQSIKTFSTTIFLTKIHKMKLKAVKSP
jgi:antitoxin component YwqK of YwqJK toxin-antitoxin module